MAANSLFVKNVNIHIMAYISYLMEMVGGEKSEEDEGSEGEDAVEGKVSARNDVTSRARRDVTSRARNDETSSARNDVTSTARNFLLIYAAGLRQIMNQINYTLKRILKKKYVTSRSTF